MTNLPPPLVSVVIPAYKSTPFIAETLEAVLAQTYPRQEIIVVNDSWPDDTDVAVKPYLDRIVYISQKNQGLAAARNVGMLRATGEYVAWLDHDDLWNPEKIALQVGYMEAHPEVVLCATDFSAFDSEGYFEASHISGYYSVIERTPGGLSGIFPEQLSFPTLGVPHLPADVPASVRVYAGRAYPNLVQGNCMHPPTAIFRRESIAKAGLLDPVFRRDTDYEYLLRVARLGPVAMIDRPLIRYRYSGEQMSAPKHSADMALSRLLVLESVRTRDPDLGATPAFRRRLGFSYVAAAEELAETRPVPALGHLLRSVGHRYLGAETARAFAKLALPRWVLTAIRAARSSMKGQ